MLLPGEEPRYCLRSEWGSGSRSLYLHGHYDVVPAQSPDPDSFPEVADGQRVGTRHGRHQRRPRGDDLRAWWPSRDERRESSTAASILQLVPDEENGKRQGGSA